MNRPFAEIDHSGDIGIEAFGSNLAEMIENATLGLFSLFCRGEVGRCVEREIQVRSSSAEDLLVDWLGEVISTVGTYGELFSFVKIDCVGEWFARGVLGGEKTDPAKHDLRFDVKAVTYHRLSVETRDDGCRGRVIFDL